MIANQTGSNELTAKRLEADAHTLKRVATAISADKHDFAPNLPVRKLLQSAQDSVNKAIKDLKAAAKDLSPS